MTKQKPFLFSPFSISALVNNLHIRDGVSFPSIIYSDVFFEIIEPEELEYIQYTYRIRPAKNFGGSFKDSHANNKRNELIFSVPCNACTDIENADEIRNHIALIERGECSFLAKVIKAEEAGAIGAIITDLTNKDYYDFYIEMVHDNVSGDTEIPAGYLSGRNGQMIKTTLEKYGLNKATIILPVNLTFTPPELINNPPWAQV